jgi:hypothetical protein
VEVSDVVVSAEAHAARLSWPLGPLVEVTLDGSTAQLAWPGGSATFALDPALAWSVRRADTDPVEGWYSAGFGRKAPASILIGTGHAGRGSTLRCTLRFG